MQYLHNINFQELIDTQWDVNLGVFDSDGHYEEELIDTQWDVNFIYTVQSGDSLWN